MAITTGWGNLYTSASSSAVSFSDFPFTYESKPAITAFVLRNGYAAMTMAEGGVSTTNPGTIALIRGASTSSQSYTVGYIAIGKKASDN